MELNAWTVDRLCSQVDQRPERPRIDLSEVTFFTPYGLVYFGMFLRYHNARGKAFDVDLPRNPAAKEYLQRQNFFDRFNFNTEAIEQGSLRRFTTSTSLNDIVDLEKRAYIAEDVTDSILTLLQGNRVHIDTSLFANIASELVDNFAQHAEQTLAALAIQYYPRPRRVVMAVGDCGVGVRASLATKFEYAYLKDRPHTEAILKALEPQVSSKRQGGMGLTDVNEDVRQANGRLTITSGNGRVMVNQLGTRFGVTSHDLSGVQVEISIPERGR